MKKILSFLIIFIMIISFLPSSFISYASEDNNLQTNDFEEYDSYDYSYLKSFTFGQDESKEIVCTFNNVNDLQNSFDVKLKEDKYVRTLGYLQDNDNGGAIYKISKTKGENGSIKLQTGLYANLVPNIVNRDNKIYAIFSVKQFGASGDGVIPDEDYINSTISAANKYVNTNENIDRAIVYIPKGQYKVDNQVHADVKNVNIIGDGDDTVIFTDNNYRKNDSYYEFFFMIWGSENIYLSDFKIEAREVDYTKYMRQLVIIDSKNVYCNNLSIIVPQEAYSGKYFVDKQYTNLTIYSGNRNITVDNCYMEQMSGTYRGANIGIMDIYKRGEENITIKNCELHDNARDEQVGIFSTSNSDTSFIKNVNFVNNTMYSYTPPYKNLYGTRTMCFTVSYADSPRVENVNISSNHFICETDSKLMTFGKISNCTVTDNSIEVLSSNGVGGYVFDSAARDSKDVLVKNNEIFLTYKDNNSQGKSAISGGKITMEGNRIFADTILQNVSVLGEYNKNDISSTSYLGSIGQPNVFKDNNVNVYGELGSILSMGNARPSESVFVDNNIFNDYTLSTKENAQPFYGLNESSHGKWDTITFTNNTYLSPNIRFSEKSQYPYRSIFYINNDNGKVNKLIVTDNKVQGLREIIKYSVGDTEITEQNNKYLDYSYDISTIHLANIDILHNNEKITEITTTEDSIKLGAICSINENDAIKQISDREILWTTSINKIATVEDGVVKRNNYGDVYVYALSKDGSKAVGKCLVHFAKATAKDIDLSIDQKEINLEIKNQYDVSYKVLPYNEVSQKLKWTVENPQIAKVSDKGIITALSEGSTKITCTTIDGSNISKSFTVNAKPITVKKINFDKSYYYFDSIGQTLQLNVVSYFPEDAVNKGISHYESSNEEVAKVSSDGLITVVGGGVCEIRGYSTDNTGYGSCMVYSKPSKVNNLVVSDIGKDNISLTWEAAKNVNGYAIYRSSDNGQTFSEIAKTSDSKYTDKSLKENTKYIYYVVSYIIKYEVDGNNTIYYSDKNNKCAATTYTYEPVRSIRINENAISTGVNGTAKIFTKVYPYTADNKGVSFTIKDTNIATVEPESEGSSIAIIRGVSEGFTSLTIEAKDGSGVKLVVPVGIINNQLVTDLNVLEKYKCLDLTWKGVKDESIIDGYAIFRTKSIEYSLYKYISKDELKKSEDGLSYLFTDTGLNNDVNYNYRIAPYIEKDGIKYVGNKCMSKGGKIVLQNNENSANIVLCDIYKLRFGEERDIYAEINRKMDAIGFASCNESIVKVTNNVNEDSTKIYGKLQGLMPGITYLSVVSSKDNSILNGSKVVVLPEDINNIKVSETANTIKLSWDKVPNATGYRIYKYSTNDKKFVKYIDTLECFYVDSSLASNTNYRYMVCPYVSDSEEVYEGTLSNEINVCTKITDKNINDTENNKVTETFDNSKFSTFIILMFMSSVVLSLMALKKKNI